MHSTRGWEGEGFGHFSSIWFLSQVRVIWKECFGDILHSDTCLNGELVDAGIPRGKAREQVGDLQLGVKTTWVGREMFYTECS